MNTKNIILTNLVVIVKNNTYLGLLGKNVFPDPDSSELT